MTVSVDTRLAGYLFDLILNGKEYPEGVFMEPVDGNGYHAVHFSDDVPKDVQAEIVEPFITSAHLALESHE